MYERAAASLEAGTPLWHLDETRTFFAGPLDYNGAHQHGAPVFLAGLYGSFGLRMGSGDWQTCRTAVVPAGAVHELDVGGDPIGVLYVEPSAGDASALAPFVACAREVDGALLGSRGEVAPMRALFEMPAALPSASAALSDLLGFGRRRARRACDPRIGRVLDALRGASDHELPTSAVRCAAAVGLSPSRFQHLFSEEIGVPFRRYRAWMRMRQAIGEIVAGANFTTAAHAAGFCDQAHFAHDFRRTFGAPASRSLTDVRGSACGLRAAAV